MLPSFELYTPETISEACRMKRQLQALLLAGGTDVFVAMHGGTMRPEVLVDIKGIAVLREFTQTKDAVSLGALTSHRFIEESDYFRRVYTALYEGCSQVGSVQIRQRGTLGGNICNAVPSADSIGPLLVFDTMCVVASEKTEREVLLKDFFLGPKKTMLGSDELLKALILPVPAPRTGSCYIKYTRRKAMDLALCGYSMLLTLDEDDTIVTARTALTTCAPTPIRGKKVEKYLLRKKPSEVELETLGCLSVEDAHPRSSWRASAEFRLEIIKELSVRAYQAALIRAKGDKQ